VPFLLLVLSLMLALIQAKFSPTFQTARFFESVAQSIILGLAPPLIGGGMLAIDLKDHWARTTLMRPVTRAEFLLARVTSVWLFTIAAAVINAWLPLLIPAVALNKPVALELGLTVPMFVLWLGQAYLVIVLMTLFSCWMPGIGNIILLGLWAAFSGLAGSYISSEFWDNGVLTITKEYVFPSGFIDAVDLLRSGGPEFWGAVLWGCAAAAGFTALAIVAFNRVTIETGSE
jgi:ABC-type transport system involved in multi-copper enzyme maturation permease subunit